MIPNIHRAFVPCLAAIVSAVLLALSALTGGPAVRARGAGHLRDLLPASSEPTDRATAQVVATENRGSTTVTLKVQAIDRTFVGTTLGAHIHAGTCVEGNGAAAGPHFNSTGGQTVSNQTEVWLDFTVGHDGGARSSTTVPFVIPPGGAGALVIHAMHTTDTGAAGARWACLPIGF